MTVNKLISVFNSFDEIFMNGKYEMSALCMLLNFGGYNIMQANILGIREETKSVLTNMAKISILFW